METLKLNARLQTREPEVLLDPALPAGRYVVSLVVTSELGDSEPARLTLTVQRQIVRPPVPGPVAEPARPTPVPPVVRPVPVTPVAPPTPVTPIARPTPVTPVRPVVVPTPVIRAAPQPRARKARAKKPRPKKEE